MRMLAIAVAAAVIAVAVPVAGRIGLQGRDETASAANASTERVDRPAIPASGLIGYLASVRARTLRRDAAHPLLRALAEKLGEPVSRAPWPPPVASVPADALTRSTASAVAADCGIVVGTRFNLEPRPAPAVAPQNGEALDFLPGAGLSGADLVIGSANDVRGLFGGLGDSNTGYYVHRSTAGSSPCAPDFEGGLPSFHSVAGGELLFGGGDSAVDADSARGAVFVVDTRLGLSVSSLGLFRNTAARLVSAGACPAGTHDGAAAGACWPEHVEVNPRSDGALNVFPHLAVDPRPAASGPGAGDVYVANTLSTLSGVFTVLSACGNSLAACSPAVVISGGDLRTQTSHVRVRPDGVITVTYVNMAEGPPPDFLQLYDLKFVTCTPRGAPSAPSCSAPTLIVREDQPVPSRGGGLGGGSLAAANFLITTHPKHDHRIDANGIETYVVWERCKVPNIHGGDKCPDADIRLAASADGGASWQFGSVDTAAGDQYFPAIRTDASNVVSVAYFTAQGDGGLNHRARIILRQIAPGGGSPDAVGPAALITAVPMEPSGDFFFGDGYIGSYIGLAARATGSGARAYIHHTHTAVNGTYNGVAAPEQNNHMSRFDY